MAAADRPVEVEVLAVQVGEVWPAVCVLALNVCVQAVEALPRRRDPLDSNPGAALKLRPAFTMGPWGQRRLEDRIGLLSGGRG